MKMYVGITDRDWFELLKSKNYREVNFWKPGTANFKALSEGDLFLFKLHAPYNYIVGGGFYESFSILPTFLAWDTFKLANGVNNLDELNQRIRKYRSRNNMLESNPQIGCILLNETFYFDEKDWIPAPEDWKNSIVQGKVYSIEERIGAKLYTEVNDRLKLIPTTAAVADSTNRFGYSMTKHRIGQGAFRIGVVDAYHRRCAISGEKTLPVLEAAHIKPVEEDGPYQINNGVLLRSDIHILFDHGYITIDDDYRIDVSDHLHEDFGNGKDYYQYKGKQIILPDNMVNAPEKSFIEWHNNNIYIG